ncbi:stage II sporulation protein M [Paenibacillus protaetiae]|uniref:Stage II sporulation protein M n=1 Tax=Paenibacillus protaetiae TaxID=2509456 RepID=A0A4P6F187_9BACL|nr:stage II sporulation protein M [Paenibacillus protaetiae]
MQPQPFPADKPVQSHFTLYLFVSILFVVGTVFGGLMVNALTLEQQQDLAADLSRFIGGIYTGASGVQDGTASFWSQLLFNAKWLLLVWVLGITVVGIPFILALDFMKGALVGFAVGTLVSTHSWRGALFSLVSVAPPNIIAVPAILMASAASLSFSLYVVNNRLLKQNGPLAPQVLSLTSTTLFMLLLLAAAALVEAYVSPVMMGWVAPMLQPA